MGNNDLNKLLHRLLYSVIKLFAKVCMCVCVCTYVYFGCLQKVCIIYIFQKNIIQL